MDSEILPPIPTPAGQRWREFRIRVLPVFVFLLVLAGTVFMWANYLQPVGIVGLVETNAVNVVTTQAGLLTKLELNRFDEVINGQVLCEVAPYDDDQLKAELGAIESSVNLIKARMDLNELSTLDMATQFRLNLLLQETLLNIARTNLLQAEAEVVRYKDLMKPPNAIAPAVYEGFVAKRDSLKSEVADRARLVAESARTVDAMGPYRTNVFAGMERAIRDDILKQQEQLRQLQKPIVLRAQIDGKVSAVLHRTGERVAAGAPILSIASSRAERIVAYIRQPLNFHPKVGDVLTVRTRTNRRRVSEAQVIRVGTQLEVVMPILLPIPKPVPELGLPIALTLPPELNLLPGEIVDIRLPRGWLTSEGK